MPKFLDTTGKSTLGIGLCDRCHFKFSLIQLGPDGNSPGLRVCKDCWDSLDPWRLPAPETESVTLEFPRPEEPLTS